jgi:hypothetical protein
MSKNSKKESVFTMAIGDLEDRVAKVKQLMSEIAELLPGLTTMTQHDRRHSDGKLRDGESEALASVLDVADKHPQYFGALADKDGGVDPDVFETELLREHLRRRKLLGELVAASQAVAAPISDSVLLLGANVRSVLLAAYAIAKPIAANDEKVKGILAPALNFYGRISRRGADTRWRKPGTRRTPRESDANALPSVVRLFLGESAS